MIELLYVVLGSLAVAAILTVAADQIEPVINRIERYLTYVATGLIVFVMVFVCAEVTMRYAFNSPIPGHLEGSELLMPMIVFFAIAYTQSVRGHVGMSLVIDALPEHIRNRTEIVTLILSACTYCILTYFSVAHAWTAYIYDDVTMSPPFFLVWPSAAVVPLGFGLCAIRMYLQILQLINPTRYAFPEQLAPGLRASGD